MWNDFNPEGQSGSSAQTKISASVVTHPGSILWWGGAATAAQTFNHPANERHIV
jgi:hypothetical protein